MFATVLLILVYFIAVGLITEPSFAKEQFIKYWYFLISLAVGFGLQIGMYVYLKTAIQNHNMAHTKQAVAVTGTTSTLTMISCCAHYLANIVPILGIAGFLTVIAQYQVQFFWAGLAFNLFGIIYVGRQIIKFSARGGSASGGRPIQQVFTPLDKY